MTLKEQIIFHLKQNISNLNKPIPSEKEICIKFSCSRGTARTALQSLVDQGFLISKKGKGYFVNKQLHTNKIKPFKEAIPIKTSSKIDNVKISWFENNTLNISKALTYQKKRYHNDKLIEVSNIIINKYLISKFNINVASESLVEYLLYDQGIKLSVEKNYKKSIKNNLPEINTTCEYLIYSKSLFINDYDEVVCFIESFLAVEYFEIKTNYYG